MKVVAKIFGCIIGAILYPFFWLLEWVLLFLVTIFATIENMTEVDEVIAEKDKEIQGHENLCESYRKDCYKLAAKFKEAK